MLIVDAQIHIWGANTPERPWPPGRRPPHRPEPFSKDDALREMDEAGVHRAIIIPATCEGDRNDLALAAAQLHPQRFAVMGLLDIGAPGARGQLATWCQQAGMLGLRLTTFTKTIPDWLWPEAEAAKVPIMLYASQLELNYVERAAARHPQLKLTIDHLAVPRLTKDDAAFAHLDNLLALAKYANISVKASALPCYTTDRYPFRRLHPYIRRVYDAFGPRRMFWGSDLVRLKCPYREAVTMFTEELPWLTAHDKEYVMGRGLCEWLGWELSVNKA